MRNTDIDRQAVRRTKDRVYRIPVRELKALVRIWKWSKNEQQN